MKHSLKTLAALAVTMSVASVSLMAAEIRDYVGIVRYQYHPALIKTFTDYSNSLKEAGYEDYAEVFDDYLAGGFGSGFVYVAKDGTPYVITNRHVINQAYTASFEIQDSETLESKVYEGLTVLATDEDIDVAILKFKDGEKPFRKGLTFSTSSVRDGDEVWSAGYPALGNDPMWQLGKGNVSNARAKVNELLSGDISTLIQHSAQIDSGNSGGPLLVKGSGEAGYSVVGVNTWKAVYRQNTNYSIPASVIKDFIDRTLNETKASSHSVLVKRTQDFLGNLNDSEKDFTSIVRYISLDCACSQGTDNYIHQMSYAPSVPKKKIKEAWNADPVIGMRYSMAYNYWSTFVYKDNQYVESSSSTNADGDYEVLLVSSDEKNTIKVIWTKEQGLYRIKSAAFTEDSAKYVSTQKKNDSIKKQGEEALKVDDTKQQKKESEELTFDLEAKSTFYMDCGTSIWFNGNTPSFTADMDLMLFADNFMGFGVNYERAEGPLGPYVNSFGASAVMRTPLNFHKFCINIVTKGGFEKLIDREDYDNAGLYLCAEGGVEYLFDTNSLVSPGIGITAIYKRSFMDDDSNVSGKYSDTGTIKIYAIFSL